MRYSVENVSYEEAREWFWVRTVAWFIPVALLTMMGFFALLNDVIDSVMTRLWISIGVGAAASLLALAAAAVSITLPWMRERWKLSFLINGPVCAIAAGVIAFLIGVLIQSFVPGDLPNPITEPEKFKAATDLSVLIADLVIYGTAASGVLGFLFGSWFALRRDKYFVELI